MKKAKGLTILTLMILIISLIALFLLHGRNISAYNIFLAIFGSAVLGFTMSLIEYFAAKRKALESFFHEARTINNVFSRIRYFDAEEPMEMVKDCIREESHNSYMHQVLGLFKKTTAKNNLITIYKKQFYIYGNNPPDYLDTDKWYAAQIKEYTNKLIACIDSYIEISEINLEKLDESFDNLDFLFNKHIRHFADIHIHLEIHFLIKKTLLHLYNFRLFKSGEVDLSTCFFPIQMLNEIWFKVDKFRGNTYYVFCQKHDELSDAIEEFRCKIYDEKFIPKEHCALTESLQHVFNYDEMTLYSDR